MCLQESRGEVVNRGKGGGGGSGSQQLPSLDMGQGACSDHAKSLSSPTGAARGSMLGGREETDSICT